MKIGRVTRVLEDFKRKEQLIETADNRKISISFYYPIDNKWEEKKQALYKDLYSPKEDEFIKIFSNFSQIENFEERKTYLETIKTNIYDNAPIDKQHHKYPIIIQITGLGAPKDYMVYNIEKLVSAGYVVFTIGHFYDSMLNILPSGEMVKNPQNELSQDDKIKILEIRKDDIIFLLNNLEKLNRNDCIMKNKLDLKRIGVLGHSLGGAAAFLSSQCTTNIKATVLFDASLQFFNLDNCVKDSLKTPTLNFRRDLFDYESSMTMFINHIKDRDDGEEFKKKILIYDKILRDSDYEQKNLYKFLSGYKSFIKLKSSNHMTFTDYPMLINKKMESDFLSVDKAHEIINDITINFFDEFLCEKHGRYSKIIKDDEYITIFEEDMK